ncbi:nucleotidyltransferase [Autumnicola edwardsiae]|uniref:Nucleotidyltransferase n=1 Tax=Autumnicola edwardsiae TaxID=3075594 RepID=A0ABU3CYG7_9FLAO|nr:nucleotidyltransferase [Zunongwangia sp. F297]MDT0651237.1 nucleotidyltransferase [Zunongwangia sp. F297]
MITTTKHTQLFLEQIAKILDITEAQYNQVVQRYTAVSNHLAQEDSELSRFQPDIKPQGSFLYGTMIRPIFETDELDVDLVCRLKGKMDSWAQLHLKQAVGDRIKENADYDRMLDDEGDRCWTLVYSGAFHLDILPAIVGQEHYTLFEKSYAGLAGTQVEALAIRMTDRNRINYKWDPNTQHWPKSNPFGYAKWLKDRASLAFLKGVILSENVEPLPGYTQDKEPLIRIVQILKRHRDIMFGEDDCEKPISIIITTLAAKAYNKETDILQGLLNVLEGMENHIEDRYSIEHQKQIKWIANPVNPVEENFADRWPSEPKKQIKFYDWLEKAKEDFGQIQHMNLSEAYEYLKEILGTRTVNEALKELGLDTIIKESKKPVNYSSTLLAVPHRQRPIWPEYNRFQCRVYAHYKIPIKNKRVSITGSTIVPKSCFIYFTAATNVPKPSEVYWQVVNNGEEAKNNKCLRGNIFHAGTMGAGGLKYKDKSAFTGLHWIECFIVKNGVCVARSSEFFVNIQ